MEELPIGEDKMELKQKNHQLEIFLLALISSQGLRTMRVTGRIGSQKVTILGV